MFMGFSFFFFLLLSADKLIKFNLKMWTYCIELRQRLLKYLGFLVFCFIGCFYYSNEIFRQVLHPLIKVLTGQDMLVITKIGQGVLLPLELAVTCACILSIPFGLLQLWKFVLPALHK